MKCFDFLVIGSGISGLVYALEVSKIGKVALLTKKTLADGATDFAQGGIAAVVSELDTFDEHVVDTYKAGSELGKLPIIRAIVEDGPQAIDYLMKIGTAFTMANDKIQRSMENLDLTREGGHSQKRVVHYADSTGHEIMRALIRTVRETPNITIYENYTAIDLITQHHVLNEKGFIPGVSCWGAYALDENTGQIEAFRARKTMLATGGGAQVYAHTTNPEVCTGDGFAMAKLAGARLVNMEFIQFHPTVFYSLIGQPFLVTEALRGEGAILKLANGKTFMDKYHEMGSLAPRDVVSRAMDFELKKSGEKHLYLDATGLSQEKIHAHFPNIYRKCLEQKIDITKEPIPVTPAAHYFCGGVLTTQDGLTDVKNLFAAGEVACIGLHGANRLASNSLLEGLVTALRASRHPSNHEDVDFPEIPEWQDVGTYNENEWVVISHNRQSIKSIMQGYVGITRSKRLLKYAKHRMHSVYTEINNFYNHNSVRREVIETRNMAIVGSAIIQSALMRKESRGLHYNVDYPNRDDANYKRDTII